MRSKILVLIVLVLMGFAGSAFPVMGKEEPCETMWGDKCVVLSNWFGDTSPTINLGGVTIQVLNAYERKSAACQFTNSCARLNKKVDTGFGTNNPKVDRVVQWIDGGDNCKDRSGNPLVDGNFYCVQCGGTNGHYYLLRVCGNPVSGSFKNLENGFQYYNRGFLYGMSAPEATVLNVKEGVKWDIMGGRLNVQRGQNLEWELLNDGFVQPSLVGDAVTFAVNADNIPITIEIEKCTAKGSDPANLVGETEFGITYYKKLYTEWTNVTVTATPSGVSVEVGGTHLEYRMTGDENTNVGVTIYPVSEGGLRNVGEKTLDAGDVKILTRQYNVPLTPGQYPLTVSPVFDITVTLDGATYLGRYASGDVTWIGTNPPEGISNTIVELFRDATVEGTLDVSVLSVEEK